MRKLRLRLKKNRLRRLEKQHRVELVRLDRLRENKNDVLWNPLPSSRSIQLARDRYNRFYQHVIRTERKMAFLEIDIEEMES